MSNREQPLRDRVALVAGATRGCGRAIATELGALGATVYASGRTTREQRSVMDRPETIEDTAERVTAAGGTGIAVRCDHSDPADVTALVDRIRADHGRLDVLVNDVWGGDPFTTWGKTVWEHSLEATLTIVRNGIETHLITSHLAIPLVLESSAGLVVEVGDGKGDVPYRTNVPYDLVKNTVVRLGEALAWELRPHGVTALSVTPGFLRSESMLDNFGVTEETWREAAERVGYFQYSETPAPAGPRGRRAGRRPGAGAVRRPVPGLVGADARVRPDRRRRRAAGLGRRGPRGTRGGAHGRPPGRGGLMPRPRTVSDDAILDAVLALAQRVGPARVTLAAAAREVGLSAATLVQRFGTKRELLLAADKRGVDLWVAALEGSETSPLARVVEGLVRAAGPDTTPEQMANSVALLQLDLAEPDFHAETLRGAQAVRARIAADLSDAQAAGELRRDTDVPALANLVETIYHGAMIGWGIHREGSLQDWMRDQVEATLAPHRAPG